MFSKIDKKIFGMISSIFTLVVALVLSVISLTISWFANNEDVGANGMNINVDTPEGVVVNGKRYKAIQNNTSYTRGEEINIDNRPAGYNMLGAYDKVIYEFEVEGQDIESMNLTLTLTSENRNGNFVQIVDKYYNFLSNVAVFQKLTRTNNVYTPTNAIKYSFNFYSDRTQVTEIDMGEVAENGVICLLFDYSEVNLNALFTANTGFDDTVYFVEDIGFTFR